MDVLQHKRPFMALSPFMCPLCRKDGESGNQIFLHCSYSSKVWIYFLRALSWNLVMPDSVEGLFHIWEGGGVVKGAKGKIFIHALLQGILWGLWKERNNRIFKDKERSVWRVIDSIIYEVASWVSVKDKFKFYSLNDLMRDWMECIMDVSGRTSPSAPLVPSLNWHV